MKDIELAIQKEQEYIDAVYSMKEGDEHPDILYYLNQADYNNVEEFYNDKQDYILKSIEFRDWEATSDEMTYHLGDNCDQLMQDKESCIFYNIDMDQLSAFVPSNFTKGEYAKELGITPIYGKYASKEGHGIIITGDGDLKIAMICPSDKSGIQYTIARKLVEYFKHYYDDVVFTGNDILVNDKKVVGFATRTLGDMCTVMFNTNFHDYMYYINALCCKYEKEPGYIDKFTVRELLNEFKSWLHLF